MRMHLTLTRLALAISILIALGPFGQTAPPGPSTPDGPTAWKLLYLPPVVSLFSGAATYDYPLQVSPGRNGLQPHLRLTYNSRLADGLLGYLGVDAGPLGVGWTLTTLDILRTDFKPCGRNVCFTDDAFTLLLDGAGYDLTPADSKYHGRFFAKDAPWLYIERRNFCADSPDPFHAACRQAPRTGSLHNTTGDYWYVRLPDGTEARLGYTHNSEQVLGGVVSGGYGGGYGGRFDLAAVRRWRVDVMTDTFQNTMTFTYHELADDAGHTERWSLLDHIEYNRDDQGRYLSAVVFAHDGRLGADGAGPAYTAIHIWNAGQHARVYRLTVGRTTQYDCGLTLNHAHLDAIRVWDHTMTQALPATRMTYDWLPNQPVTLSAAPCYRYPRLSWIENGYGGADEFFYLPDGYWAPGRNPLSDPTAVGQSYSVNERRTYDSVHAAPAHIRYRYDQACRAISGAPCAGPRPPTSAPLTGYGAVTAWVYDYDQRLLETHRRRFHLDHARLGQPYQDQRLDPHGQVLRQVETTWDVSPNGRAGFAHPVRVLTTAFSGGAAWQSRIDYAHDGYGNLIRVARHGDLGLTGDEAIVERTFTPNPAAWIVAAVARERVLAGDGALQTQTEYAYDGQAFGAPPRQGKRTHLRRGDGTVWTETWSAYDAWGNPIRHTDGLGRTTVTHYDPQFHLFPILTSNPLGQLTATQWNVRLGVPVSLTDANGGLTRMAHDFFGRVIFVLRPGEDSPAVKYTYPTGDPLHAPVAIKTETRLDPYTTPTYAQTWTLYDGLGRTVQTQTETESGWLIQTTAYDARSRPVAAVQPYTTSRPAPGGYFPWFANLPGTHTRYDALDRVTQVTAPDGTHTRTAYRGRRALTLDAEGHQTEHITDGLGRLVAVRVYEGRYDAPDWGAPASAITRYWHDPQDHLLAIQDALGNITRLTYDSLGRKVAIDEPSMGRWTYTYDAADNLIAQTDALGRQLAFDYDKLNRPTAKWQVHGETRQLLAQYAYDQGPNGVGHRTTLSDTTGLTQWAYDPLGRRVRESRAIVGAGVLDTGWQYDAADRPIRLTYPTGEVVATRYNKRGLIEQVSSQRPNTPPYLAGAGYNAAAQPTWQAWGNGRMTTYAYWPGHLRLQQLRVSGDLLDLTYTYDHVGNVRSILDAFNAVQTQYFAYDSFDRLTGAATDEFGQGQYAERYTYNAVGNLVTRSAGQTTHTYTYGRPAPLAPSLPVSLPHRVAFPLVLAARPAGALPPPTFNQPFAVVSTTAGFRAGYDLNGNMVWRVEVAGGQPVTFTQAWDIENRLTAITNTVTGQTTRWWYNGDGQCVKRADARGVTVYAGPHFEKNLTSGLATSYYYAGNQRIAMRAGENLYWLHQDHLGSTAVVANAWGNAVSRLHYLPYGELRAVWGQPPTDRRFTGQRDEAALGLYQYGARFYSPALGRFLSADPLVPEPGRPASLNRYAYVYNNPLRYTDPTGYFTDDALKDYLRQLYGETQWGQYWLAWTADKAWMAMLHEAQAGDMLARVTTDSQGHGAIESFQFLGLGRERLDRIVAIQAVEPNPSPTAIVGLNALYSHRGRGLGLLRFDSQTGDIGVHGTLGEANFQTHVVDTADYIGQRGLVAAAGWAIPGNPTWLKYFWGFITLATGASRDSSPGWRIGDNILQISIATYVDPGEMLQPMLMYSTDTYIYRYGVHGGKIIAHSLYYGPTEPFTLR